MGIRCRGRRDTIGEDRGTVDLGDVDVGDHDVAVGGITSDRWAGGQEVGRSRDERDLAAVTADRRLSGAGIAADDLRAGRHPADQHDGAIDPVVAVDLRWAGVDARRQGCADHEVDGGRTERDVGAIGGDCR